MTTSPATLCPACAGTGFCPCCKGESMLLVTFIADICPRCGSLNEIENGEQRLWCPDCGGQPLMYEQLVECEECTGDGSCLTCKGSGHARA